MARRGEIQGGALHRLIKIGKGEDPCWEWIGGVTPKGYPRRMWMGRELSARRWVFLLLFGPISKHKVLEPKCGNRLCVNPQHMKVTTLTETQRNGETTILLEEEVIEMRRKLEHPDARARSFTNRLITDVMETTGACRRTVVCALGNHSWFDPTLPRGIAAIVRHHAERS